MSRDDDNETVLYEVNLEADAAIAGPFDTWLRDHIADMLQFPGFLSAEVLDDAAAPTGRIRRIVQYRLRDQAALERYLREQAPAMRERGVALFGDRFTAQRRSLAHREEFIRGAVSTENCLNCGEVLTGQHCSHCGQRARVRVLSLTGLLRDLFGDLVDFDSRIWRTIFPLAFRPGLLTSEFLRGRRTYYTPPFRMYLTLSVVFFLATTLGSSPGDAVKLNLGPDGANLQLTGGDGAKAPEQGAAKSSPNASAPAAPAAPPVKLDPERQKIADAIIARLPENSRADARKDLEQELARLTPDQVKPVKRMVEDPCSQENIHLDIGPLGKQYEPRMREACRKIVSDSRGFGRALYDNVPKMMFIFLPLIAAVMFVLYLGSGRYYVEHLLFFVHYHAFFFLAGLLVVLLDRTGAWLQGTAAGAALKVAEGIVATVLVFYVPYYLYRAMRRVYGQGRIVTLLKYSILGVGYVFFMAITAVGLLVYTAMTL
ncbi:MAG TPA: DUF4286 family protein [Steroidobacteraceae bacterium]